MLNEIINDNCLNMFKRMEDDSVDYVFTSPPYNRRRNDKYAFYNDDDVDYYEFMSEVIEQSMRVSKEHVFINIQKNYYNKQDVFKLIGKYADKIVDIIVWNKTNPMPASGHNITNAYEFVLVLQKDALPLKGNKTYTKNVITTSVYSSNPYKKHHRAVMSPEFAKQFFESFIRAGDDVVVFDPFMGVGTTAVVAKEYGVNYLGAELSKEYVEIAKDRLRRLL